MGWEAFLLYKPSYWLHEHLKHVFRSLCQTSTNLRVQSTRQGLSCKNILGFLGEDYFEPRMMFSYKEFLQYGAFCTFLDINE